MLGSMSQHLRVLVGLLDDLTLKDMETRLANWLLKHCPLPMDDRAIEFKLDRTKRRPRGVKWGRPLCETLFYACWPSFGTRKFCS